MVRFAPLLVIAVVAGFLVGGCGAGGGGTALTTGTRTLATTLPARTDAAAPITTQVETSVVTTIDVTTIELTTEASRTSEITTVVQEPVTTTAVLTVTTAPPAVETSPAVPVTTVAQTTTAEAVASTSDTSPWLLVGLAFLAIVVVVLVLWSRRRGATSSWARGMSDLRRRSLVMLDDVLANGSLVTGRVQALVSEGASLEAQAPGDAERADAARLRASLGGLAETLETDRTLRLNSPPPSAEQLEYSTARIRHQAQDLQGVLRPPEAGGAYAR
jgi:hypothetical protein